MENARGFNGFSAGGFRCLASGPVASANWIHWIPQKNPARQGRDLANL
jgi:hypothetical protein